MNHVRTGREEARGGDLTTRSRRAFPLPVLVAVTLLTSFFAFVPAAPAGAVTCTKTWTAATSGLWSDGTKWTPAGAPASTDDVCVTVGGTYTVTVTGANSANSLTLGGASGTQTVSLLGSNALSSQLTLAASSSTGANGVIELASSGSGYAFLDSTGGTVTNAGLIHVLSGGSNNRLMDGAYANSGTITLDTNLTSNTATGVTNTGTVNIADTLAWQNNSGSFTNNAGGTIAAAGSGTYYANSGTFTEGNGTTSGTQPVTVSNGAIVYNGSGASHIFGIGNGTLAGAVTSGQTLTIQGSNAASAERDVNAAFSNAGLIELTSTGSGYAWLNNTAGTVTNTGTIHVFGVNGNRFLYGTYDNSGTINVDANLTSNTATAVTNTGTVNIADTMTWQNNSGSFTNNTSGTIATAGSGTYYANSGTFTEGNGTTSGTQPVTVLNGAIVYNGNGASHIFALGNGTLAGAITSGQTLTIQGSNAASAERDVNAAFTNAGLIELTSTGSGYGWLNNTAGTVTNTGTIHVFGVNGQRFLYGTYANSGTINVDVNLTSNTATAVTNTGTVNVANGASWQNNSGTFTNNAGGTIAAAGSGTYYANSGTFAEGNGTTTGTQPVTVLNGAIVYAGTGHSTIVSNGTGNLSGNVSAGQTLVIQGSSAASAQLTTAAGWSNKGTVQITTVGSGYAWLNNTVGLFTNDATVLVDGAGSGTTYLYGAFTNTKTLTIKDGKTLTGNTNAFTQTSKGTLNPVVTNATTYGKMSGFGALSLAGTLSVTTTKPFNPTVGQTYNVIAGSSRSGTFAKYKSIKLKNGKYYLPSYTATGMNLVVKLAAVSLNPTSGNAGSTVQVTGSGFAPGETVKLVFQAKNKVKTPYPNVIADGSGNFVVNETVPAGAVLGAGSITATGQAFKIAAKATFTVT